MRLSSSMVNQNVQLQTSFMETSASVHAQLCVSELLELAAEDPVLLFASSKCTSLALASQRVYMLFLHLPRYH